MQNRLCDRFGIEFPLFAFSHCRDVVVAVSRAGGFGVLGASGLLPDQLERELQWIDAHIDGKPYGVDLIVPGAMEGRDEQPSAEEVLARIPPEHLRFVDEILQRHGIDTSGLTDAARRDALYLSTNTRLAGAENSLDVAFAHPIRLIVNALGVPPPGMLARGKAAGVAVGALVGAREHAVKQVQAGVDLLIVAGGEAGGHCGEVSTLVLVPEVHDAIRDHGDVPILAAGGIVTGRQMAAAMALGAEGAWCGSVWLTTAEAETSPVIREKMLKADSRGTVRSRSRTGKPARQLRTPWTDAWERPDAPPTLPMPLQSVVANPPLWHVDKLAQSGHPGAVALATYYVGQGVGLMNEPLTVRQVVQAFREDFVRGFERLSAQIGA